LTELALRLLVVSDHRLGAANVTGEDHGVSLLRVKQRKAQPFIFRRNFNAVISASGRRVSHCCSLCCPSRAFRTLTDPQTSEEFDTRFCPPDVVAIVPAKPVSHLPHQRLSAPLPAMHRSSESSRSLLSQRAEVVSRSGTAHPRKTPHPA